MTYWVYNALATVLLLIALPFSPLLYCFGKRYSMGLGERLGWYGRGIRNAVKGSRPVWIHAASFGEILVAIGLVEEIKRRLPDRPIVVSAFTCTGYELARRILARERIEPRLHAPDRAWLERLERRIDPVAARTSRRHGGGA